MNKNTLELYKNNLSKKDYDFLNDFSGKSKKIIFYGDEKISSELIKYFITKFPNCREYPLSKLVGPGITIAGVRNGTIFTKIPQYYMTKQVQNDQHFKIIALR